MKELEHIWLMDTQEHLVNLVVIIAGQNGPGATNLVTGVAQAKAAFSPVISIAGAISTEHEGKDAFQEVDQQSLFEPITKKTFTVRQTELIPQTLKKAFSLALTPRCGPVHLNFPRNILANECQFDEIQKHEKEIISVEENDLINILKIIDKAKKPVIIAGGGVKNSLSHESVLKISTYLNIPIVASAGHGDVIPLMKNYMQDKWVQEEILLHQDLLKKLMLF